MARAYTPSFGRNYAAPSRRVISVAELERRYGRNAQVELRSPPTADYGYEPEGYGASYLDEDGYDAEPIELPVQRSPWLPIVMTLMLGIGVFLGYALYRRGMIPASLMHQQVALQETEALPSTAVWQPPRALPVVEGDDVPSLPSNDTATNSPEDTGANAAENSADPGAAPAEGAATNSAQDRASVTTKSVTPTRSAGITNGNAAASVGTRRARRYSSSNEDEAATMAAIRREREQLGESASPAPAPPAPASGTSKTEGDTHSPSGAVYPQPTTPPGYIEAETH